MLIWAKAETYQGWSLRALALRTNGLRLRRAIFRSPGFLAFMLSPPSLTGNTGQLCGPTESAALPHRGPLARYSPSAAFMPRLILNRDSARRYLRVGDFALLCARLRCCNMKR